MSFYMLKRQDSFYFRIRVPQDLLQHFTYPEIKRSLRTKDPYHAKSQAKLMSSKAENVFMMLRSNVLAPGQVQEYIRRELPSIWKKCKKEPLPLPSRNQREEQQKKSKRLQQVSEAYIQEHVVLKKWTEKTIIEFSSQLVMFQKVVGDVPIRSIDRAVMVGYLETLKRLPAGISNKPTYRDKSIKEIMAMPDVVPMSNTTVNKYIERAGALFLWCIRQDFLDRNPAQGLTIAKTKSEDELRSAYSLDDIERIKKTLSKVEKNRPERYWVPRIGCYSGARLNEICQLYVSDVVKVDEIWCFDINGEKDKRLKNLASKRMIPIHPKLLELGFVDYVEQLKVKGVARLWERLPAGRDGYSHLFSKWYQRHNREHITQDKRKCFHSFRHLVCDTLKQAGIETSVISELVGHTHAGGNITISRYGKRFRPQILLDALMKLDY